MSWAALVIAASADRRPASIVSGPHRVTLLPRFGSDYVRLLVLASLAGAALGMFARTMLHFATYFLGDTGVAAPVLLALIVGQFAGVLLWTTASQRWETVTLLIVANALTSAAIGIFALVDRAWLFALAGDVGVMLAGVYSLPWTLLANTVDAEDARLGERREAQSYAVFVVALKTGAALSMAASGWAMSAAGYAAGTGGSHLPGTLLAMTLAVPISGGILSAWLVAGISATQARHAEDMRILADRAA